LATPQRFCLAEIDRYAHRIPCAARTIAAALGPINGPGITIYRHFTGT